jgi:hypothetical protein
MADPEISRFPRKERPYMPGSKTTPGLAGARNDAPASVALRGVNNVGTRVYNAFAAQWLAYTLPYRRFAVILAEDGARIGGDVGCYSFIAVDSHHILLAGLPAHSLSLILQILSIDPRQNWGYTRIRALSGILPEDFPIRKIWHTVIDCQRGIAKVPWGAEIELAPFFGVMGVAPPPV